MRDLACGLPRTPILRRWVNRHLIPTRIVLVPVEDASGEVSLLDIAASVATIGLYLHIDCTTLVTMLAHNRHRGGEAFVAYGLHGHK
jgi:hypothetical protein